MLRASAAVVVDFLDDRRRNLAKGLLLLVGVAAALEVRPEVDKLRRALPLVIAVVAAGEEVVLASSPLVCGGLPGKAWREQGFIHYQ